MTVFLDISANTTNVLCRSFGHGAHKLEHVCSVCNFF